MLLVSGKSLATGVDNVMGDITVSYGLQQVAEMTVNLTDTGGVMTRSDLASIGTQIAADNGTWQVGGMNITNIGDDTVAWSVRARSELARRLRKKHGQKLSGVTSTEWVTNRVKSQGGVAVCQPSQRKARVDASSDQTVLSVIDALAQDLGWSWAEYGGRLLFMDPFWVWDSAPSILPMWRVTWGKDPATDALSLSVDLDDDDDQALGTGQITLPHPYGRKLRPLHIADLGAGIGGKRAGAWCITGVEYVLNRPESPVNVQIARPRKGIPQVRTSTAGSGGDGLPQIGDLGSGEWIEGKDKRWLNCTRTPAQYVAWAVARNNTEWPDAQCLRWVSNAVSGEDGRGGYYARYVWEKRPPGTWTTSSRTPPIGAIVVWDQASKGGHGGAAGHIGISLGGGRFISATSGRVQVLTISGGWLGGYFGAMAPNFYT